MRGFDAVRALLGYEYPMGSWFCVPVHEARGERGVRPFGAGKVRPVILATPLGPDAVLFPRSTQRGDFKHNAHRHETGPCDINKPGWMVLTVSAAVDQRLLNEESYSCEEPEDSGLLDAMRDAMRP